LLRSYKHKGPFSTSSLRLRDGILKDTRIMTLSVIVPAFNEAENVGSNVLETLATLLPLGYDVEVVVVDDGSTDGTCLEALKAKTQHPERVLVVQCETNVGKGNALICGTRYATGDYVAFVDADLDLHPGQLPLFFETMASTGADVVIGSKYHPDSNIDIPWVRKIYSVVYFALIRMLFGLPIRDSQTGLKLFKRQVLRDAFPRVLVKRFGFDIELLVNVFALRYKIAEAPVTLRFQRAKSRVQFRDAWRVLQDTLAVYYRLRVLGFYGRIPKVQLEGLPAVKSAQLHASVESYQNGYYLHAAPEKLEVGSPDRSETGSPAFAALPKFQSA